MSTQSSYKPSDMVQSMEVKISSFTQQFSQTEINNLALGKNNQIRLTNPAMVNHIRNSNLSSLTPSIEITPKYTTLNQQSSGIGQPPAIANAGTLSNTGYSTVINLTEFTDMVNGSPTNGQTISFASTQSVITGIAVDTSGRYVCIGFQNNRNGSTPLELHVLQLNYNNNTTPTTYSLSRVNYLNYLNYNNIPSYFPYLSPSFYAIPMIAIQSNGDYIAIIQYNATSNYYCVNISSSQSTWGTFTLLYNITSYSPMSITIDNNNYLYVVDGVDNNIYCYQINSNNLTQIASTVNGNNSFNGVTLNFGLQNNPNAYTQQLQNCIIAAAPSGGIVVADVANQRILSLNVNSNNSFNMSSSTPFTNFLYVANLTGLLYMSNNGYNSSFQTGYSNNALITTVAIAFDNSGTFFTLSTPITYTTYPDTWVTQPSVQYNQMSLYSSSSIPPVPSQSLFTPPYLVNNTNSQIYCSMANIAIDSNGNVVFNPSLYGNNPNMSLNLPFYYSISVAMKGS